MSSTAVTTVSVTNDGTTYEVYGMVKLYSERVAWGVGSILHGVHEGTCLKCGATEEWVAEGAYPLGTLEAPRGKTVLVTL